MSTTWNPSDKAASITLSGSDLVATASGSGNSQLVRATTSKNAHKWYFELTVTTQAGSGGSGQIGFALGATSVNSNLALVGDDATCTSGAFAAISGSALVNNLGVTFTDADVCDVAVDFDAGQIWFGKNGTWTASGNPATGANPNITFTPNQTLFPAWGGFDASNVGTANFGATAFANTKPTGFSAWNNYILDAAAGSFALTGAAITMPIAWHLLAAAGSFALTGQAAQLIKGFRLACAAGSFALTGATIAFIHTVGGAAKLALRQTAAVLQKLRVTDPTLDQ